MTPSPASAADTANAALPNAATSPRARRWPRVVVASKLAQLEADVARGTSHREWAEVNHVPRSTSQNWARRKASIEGSADLVAFFESPLGHGFSIA